MFSIGLYQWRAIILHGFTCLLVAMSTIGILLIAPRVQHRCTHPSDSFQNLTSSERGALMGTCHAPDLDFEKLSTEEIRARINESHLDRSRQCEYMEFDHTMFDYTATEQYGLVCERRWLISFASTIYMLGFFVAALASGALSDRYGRRYVYLWSQCLMLVSHLMAAFSPWLPLFLLARFLVGMTDVAAYTCGIVLTVEYVRKDQRKYPKAAAAGGFGLGCVVIAGISYGVRSHVYLQLIIALCSVPLALSTWLCIEESPRWLSSQGRRREAYAVVEKVAAMNEVPVTHLEHLHVATEIEDGRKRRPTNFLDLFRTPLIRKRTFVLGSLWFSLVLVYYALMYSLGDFGDNVRLNMIVSGVFEIPSVVLAVATIDVFGRQGTMFVCRLMMGICCLAMMPFVTNTHSPYLLIFAIAGKFFGATEFLIIYIYSQELYPTVIRNMGVGGCSTVGRMAGMLAPQIALLNEFWPPLQVVVLGVVSIMGALLLPLLPETTSCELLQSIQDGENFHPRHRYHLSFSFRFSRSRSNSARSVAEKVGIEEPLNTTV